MPYNVTFEEEAENDLAEMPPPARRQVLRAIQERIMVAPLAFGKQLKHGLSGYRSLRVGDWRIGYTVDENNVSIAHIELRRDAYKGW